MDSAECKEFYSRRFDEFERGLTANGWSAVRDLRREAMAAFVKTGFPTTRVEDWKYTDVTPLAKTPFERASPEAAATASAVIRQADDLGMPRRRVVFVNGYYEPKLSHQGPFPGGIAVTSLRRAFREPDDGLQFHLTRYADYNGHAFVALNTAFMEDGAVVFVPAGAVVEEPICLLFASTRQSGPVVRHPRNLIVIGDRGEARLVECYAGPAAGPSWTNRVEEVVLGEGASLDHVKLQIEGKTAYHFGVVQARLGRGSRWASHWISAGGALVRHEVNAVLAGEGAECALNGLYITNGEQHIDNHTVVDHVAPRGTSRELYKGVLADRSKGIFSGKIVVRGSAYKTDARQANKNLLLSEGAWADSKPQLEIFNNDVKCSHGSSIGQLDPDALFYLRSRGLDARGARSLLTSGFAREVLARIRDRALRDRLDDYLTQGFESFQ
jgi:Fe-S cluster assembly protein SufD